MKSRTILMILGFVTMGMVSAEDQYFRRADPAERIVKRDDDYDGGAGQCGKGAFGGVFSSIPPFVFMLIR
jgi:hypothetical protein